MLQRIKRQGWRLLFWLLFTAAVAVFVWQFFFASSFYTLSPSGTDIGDMPAPRAGQKIVIFAPHEDDETLGCAGYIQQAVAVGATVRVVLMTNGEYPELSVVLFEETLPNRPKAFINLGYMRQRETLAAMNALGVPAGQITFLGYPNEYLNQMWEPAHWRFANPVRSIRTQSTRSPFTNSFTPGAIYCGESVLRDVRTILQREKPDVVITLHPNDLHVDHWPTYTFVQFALNELAAEGVPFARTCPVYTYLIHRGRHWPVPLRYEPTAKLEPPAPLAAIHQTDWLALPLTVAQTLEKHKDIGVYRTQGAVFDRLLQAFARANELYGVIPPRRWQSGPVTLTPVIHDPVADLSIVRANGPADISTVEMGHSGRHLLVAITTRTPVNARVGYHVAFHCGGDTPAQRLLVEYDWQGKKAGGLLFHNGQLESLTPADLHAGGKDHTTTLEASWPIPEHAATFFLIRAWTTIGSRVIDETAATPYSITAK